MLINSYFTPIALEYVALQKDNLKIKDQREYASAFNKPWRNLGFEYGGYGASKHKSKTDFTLGDVYDLESLYYLVRKSLYALDIFRAYPEPRDAAPRVCLYELLLRTPVPILYFCIIHVYLLADVEKITKTKILRKLLEVCRSLQQKINDSILQTFLKFRENQLTLVETIGDTIHLLDFSTFEPVFSGLFEIDESERSRTLRNLIEDNFSVQPSVVELKELYTDFQKKGYTSIIYDDFTAFCRFFDVFFKLTKKRVLFFTNFCEIKLLSQKLSKLSIN